MELVRLGFHTDWFFVINPIITKDTRNLLQDPNSFMVGGNLGPVIAGDFSLPTIDPVPSTRDMFPFPLI